jgi:hypothetical protein
MHKESVLASGVLFFTAAMLIAWFPMTGPSCSHTTTDIGHCSPVSYHNLRQESQLIPFASGRGSFQYRPLGQEEAAPVWRLELIHGAGWLAGIRPSRKQSDHNLKMHIMENIQNM